MAGSPQDLFRIVCLMRVVVSSAAPGERSQARALDARHRWTGLAEIRQDELEIRK